MSLHVRCMASGAVQVRMEEQGMQPRWESPDIVTKDTLEPAQGVGLLPGSDATAAEHLRTAPDASVLAFTGADGKQVQVVVNPSPLSVKVFVEAQEMVAINTLGKMYLEQRRQGSGAARTVADTGSADEDKPQRKILDWGEDGKPIYEDGGSEEDAVAAVEATGADAGREPASADGAGAESFGGHTDSKPHGPMSVGTDIVFPSASHVYGIPEHATDLALKNTDGSNGGYSEPYRLYNLDVFEYELDNPMALYGSIPVMLASATSGATAGVFWNNPTETFVDVANAASGKSSRWMSESGVFDLWVLPGPSAHAVFRQYALITGTQALPPKFALAYHQCRWNYKDEGDVMQVDQQFEAHDFPYDVIWLDIEHTDGKRYFTWDKPLFPDPVRMQEALAARGHKMVTIVDPHIKRDGGYHVHSEATSKGLYIKNTDGSDFDGWCWPGSSSYLDFTAEHVREWWADQFALDKYQGSTLNLFTWNDMNEPSVFNGPEVSMQKDKLSLAGVEHREWHNLYGFYQQMATARGHVKRSGDTARPFVLSRAFAAGSQRVGAIWTGDNAAEWSHLEASVPMLLTINLAGLHFAGADVGGFFGNPDAELMTRWYQAGAYQPFFRAHAHIDAKRREPWLFGEETTEHLRSAVRERYALLPFWYTVYYTSHTQGLPVMRPLWVEFPGDAALLTEQRSWLVGSDLLVAPVMQQGASSVDVAFPGDAGVTWYDVRTHAAVAGGSRSKVHAPIHVVPVYQRSGSIIPRQERPRRSSALMASDPFTLTAAVGADGSAAGSLFMDDELTFAYAQGDFSHVAFSLQVDGNGNGSLQGKRVGGNAAFAPANTVERVTVLGFPTAPKAVTGQNAAGAAVPADFEYDVQSKVLTVRKPQLVVAGDWTLAFQG